MKMLYMEYLRLVRNHLSALVSGYIVFLILLYNGIAWMWGSPGVIERWQVVLAIVLVAVLLDMLFWLAALQISEDMESRMIQVMRTSRNLWQYFFGKHLLLLILTVASSAGIMLFQFSRPWLVLQFVGLTTLAALIMIGAGVVFAMLLKKQNSVMGAGSVLSGLMAAALLRVAFPNWKIAELPGNPFEYFISAYYNLLLPPRGFEGISFDRLMLLSIAVYALSLAFFYFFTYRRGIGL